MMNLRIPLSVFAVASVIGVMAVTTITAMSMQKAYSQTSEWCFKENGQYKCFSSATKCNQERSAMAPPEKKDEVPPCEQMESSHLPHD